MLAAFSSLNADEWVTNYSSSRLPPWNDGSGCRWRLR